MHKQKPINAPIEELLIFIERRRERFFYKCNEYNDIVPLLKPHGNSPAKTNRKPAGRRTPKVKKEALFQTSFNKKAL
jgi:hypothetical protein